MLIFLSYGYPDFPLSYDQIKLTVLWKVWDHMSIWWHLRQPTSDIHTCYLEATSPNFCRVGVGKSESQMHSQQRWCPLWCTVACSHQNQVLVHFWVFSLIRKLLLLARFSATPMSSQYRVTTSSLVSSLMMSWHIYWSKNSTNGIISAKFSHYMQRHFICCTLTRLHILCSMHGKSVHSFYRYGFCTNVCIATHGTICAVVICGLHISHIILNRIFEANIQNGQVQWVSHQPPLHSVGYQDHWCLQTGGTWVLSRPWSPH